MSTCARAAGAVYSILQGHSGRRIHIARALLIAQEELDRIARGVPPDVAHVVARADFQRRVRAA